MYFPWSYEVLKNPMVPCWIQQIGHLGDRYRWVSLRTRAETGLGGGKGAGAIEAQQKQNWRDSIFSCNHMAPTSSFIVLTNNCMTVRTDVITIVRCMAKHISVLIQNTNVFCLAKYICVLQKTFLFCKTHLCFQSVGPVCWTLQFRNDTNFSQKRDRISRKYGIAPKQWF